MSNRMILAVLAANLIWVGAAAAPASAATFSVNPTQIYLSARTATTLLTLRNDSEEPLRFQLTAFAWEQTAGGEIALTPTTDVVFFPALLTLAPKEERRIRVGTTARAGAQEKTYRIFVEELPPADGVVNGAAVRVLTRMGIPIFLRPDKEAATASLRALALERGSFAFTLANTGTVHFVPQKITVRAVGDRGAVLFERELPGWYVLAGGLRTFDLAIPPADCARVAGLSVDVEISSTSLKESLLTPGGACSA